MLENKSGFCLGLCGEVVENEKDLIEFANLHYKNHKALLGDLSHFKFAFKVHGIDIFQNKLSGDTDALKNSKTPAFRFQVRMGIGAKELYELLKTPEGYAILDPDSDPKDYGNALLGPVHWGNEKGNFARVEYAVTKLPCPLKDRDFAVANIFDDENMIMYCSSVNCSLVKGSTSYDKPDFKQRPGKLGRVRVPTTGTYKVLPVEGKENECILDQCVWLEFGGLMGFLLNHRGDLIFDKLVKNILDKYPIEN